jgi:hypothetical protein
VPTGLALIGRTTRNWRMVTLQSGMEGGGATILNLAWDIGAGTVSRGVTTIFTLALGDYATLRLYCRTIPMIGHMHTLAV